jgi:hypothetical protein
MRENAENGTGAELASKERTESYRRLSAPVETNTNFKVLAQREGGWGVE